MKRLLTMIVVFSTALYAGDKTPYKYVFEGNSYSGARDAAATWLTQHDDTGNAAALTQVANGSADYAQGSIAINLHQLLYTIGANGNASAQADSIYYLEPYMGKILKGSTGQSPVFSNLHSAREISFIDSVDTIFFTVSDDTGLDSLRVRLVRQDDDTLMLNLHFPPGVPSYTGRVIYRWKENDCGINYLSLYARDYSGYVTYRPDALSLVTAWETVDISDATVLMSYIFRSGPGPNPLSDGDANCDGYITLADPIYIIRHIFRGGPPICCPRTGIN